MKKDLFKLVGGGGNGLKPSHNHGLHLFLGCLDAKMHRGKVCYDKSSLRANAKQSSETGATHVVHWNNSRKIAFTLAEVLVTLGIIGVVSAMTVPTLMQNYQRQSYVTQLHKVYNEMSQAVLKYQTDKNAVNLREAGLGSQTEVDNFIHNYFKVVKDCGSDIPSCFASGNYRKLDGVKYPNFDNANANQNAYVLASGAAISVQAFSDTSRNIVFQIGIDTNGKKGPNIVGRDFFAMYVYNNGVIDEYSVSDDEGTYENVTAPLTQEQRERNFQAACNSNKPTWGHGCLGKILNDNWEMTY